MWAPAPGVSAGARRAAVVLASLRRRRVRLHFVVERVNKASNPNPHEDRGIRYFLKTRTLGVVLRVRFLVISSHIVLVIMHHNVSRRARARNTDLALQDFANRSSVRSLTLVTVSGRVYKHEIREVRTHSGAKEMRKGKNPEGTGAGREAARGGGE